MKKVEAINAWLDERGYDWYAEEITDYGRSVEEIRQVIVMKPSMVAMPYPVKVTDDSIIVQAETRSETKIGLGSPNFFKAMKVGWSVRKLNKKKTAWLYC